MSTVIGSMHQLVGDNLIWLAADQRQIHVLNLRSMTSRAMVCDTRERIGTMIAANELVAFTAENKATVFVGELIGQGLTKKFRFINAGQKLAITCRHRTVACATLQRDHAFVYIWHFDTQQGKSFRVERNASPISMAMDELGLLLQPSTETILLCQFLSTTSHDSDDLIYHTDAVCWRFTYAGECLHSIKQRLGDYNDTCDDLQFCTWTGTRFIPASHNGLFMVQRESLWDPVYRTRVIHKFEFDENSDTFRGSLHPRLQNTSYDRSGVVWWEDTFIGTETEEVEESIIAHLGPTTYSFLEPRTPSDPKIPRTIVPRDRQNGQNDQNDQNDRKDVFMNDKWVVRSYPGTFHVFCYDHTMQLPTTEGTLNGIGDWEAFRPVIKRCK
ncbi:hypothetical protein B5807_04509 [Epicoccum nigrum]|uniref:Uncharacterized protein n=1 Tax=Epicoccum nigrum TaxID=105696 RepID=A0A1Y2M688_EPING|nr:hypothetical protein B5807_04509 [Epicoccum nigrum]